MGSTLVDSQIGESAAVAVARSSWLRTEFDLVEPLVEHIAEPMLLTRRVLHPGINGCTRTAVLKSLLCIGANRFESARATRDTRRAFGNPALSCGGTKSSNPSPSSEESVANLTSGATGGFISAVQCSQGPRDGALRVTSYEANPPSATSGPSSPCAAPSPDLAHGAAAPGGGRQPGRPYS